MSVYSYVVLKVHTNVRKVGTHLNICLVNRTYVRWKYTCLFSYNNERSIYIMNIPLPRHFSTFSFLYYTISIYRKGEHSFPHLTFPATFLTFSTCSLYTILLYTLYIEREHTFPQLFTPFPIVLLYSLYIEDGILSPPFFSPYIYSYKVNTFTPPLSLSFWNVTYGKSLREKVFENFISIVL